MAASESDQLSKLIHEVFNGLRSNLAVRKISTEQVAAAVYLKLDPENISPLLVGFTSKCDLAQRVRSQLRERLRKEEEQIAQASVQASLFELQDFYPTFEESAVSGIYVRREDMTVEQRRENSRRLRSTGHGYLAHADALDAETDLLISQGKLNPGPGPRHPLDGEAGLSV